MTPMVDAFWRAVAYCAHPRVILWSLAPLLLAGALAFAAGWFWWEDAVAAVRATLEQWSLVAAAMQWLDSMGMQAMHALVAPMIVVALTVPVVVLLSLLLVAWLLTPAVVAMVAARRFPDLERRHGGGWLQGVGWSLACTVAALAALVLSLPLWLVPPLVVVLPPLIWGWLTYRVFAFDVLATHASATERRALLHRRRWPLLLMGVVSGLLGAAPSLLWAASAATLIFAPLLVVVSVWLYTLVFAFAACWFAHYLLAALDLERRAAMPVPAPAVVAEPVLLPPP
jgi:hypothetical protein